MVYTSLYLSNSTPSVFINIYCHLCDVMIRLHQKRAGDQGFYFQSGQT